MDDDLKFFINIEEDISVFKDKKKGTAIYYHIKNQSSSKITIKILEASIKTNKLQNPLKSIISLKGYKITVQTLDKFQALTACTIFLKENTGEYNGEPWYFYLKLKDTTNSKLYKVRFFKDENNIWKLDSCNIFHDGLKRKDINDIKIIEDYGSVGVKLDKISFNNYQKNNLIVYGEIHFNEELIKKHINEVIKKHVKFIKLSLIFCDKYGEVLFEKYIMLNISNVYIFETFSVKINPNELNLPILDNVKFSISFL